jgi:beta-aspartyl-peptidase (threonine type)
MMDRARVTLARLIVLSMLATTASLGVVSSAAHAQEARAEWAIAVHGGAGTARPEDVGSDRERQFREKLTEALSAGGDILAAGGSALDAVEAAIRIMEDSPLFNAGKGAVFNHDGRNELDASIMDGATLEAGAVASVHHVKNPITLSRRVMDSSPHVLMAGAVPRSYFFTESRWRSLQRALEAEQSADARGSAEPESAGELGATGTEGAGELGTAGTVGVVALDMNGDLAAGTSTGGRTNKRYGRIGDSPIVGAGTYADNDACAVSGTGHGEFFITNAVAYDICARVRYLDETIGDAAEYVVMGVLVEQSADGGVIAMDPNGDVAMPFNTSAMLRGYLRAGAEPEVSIFRD